MRATIGDECGPASLGSLRLASVFRIARLAKLTGRSAVDATIKASKAEADNKKKKTKKEKKKETSPVMRLLAMAPKGDAPF